MRRLGSTFFTLWMFVFVPSLVVWGLMLRWSASAADRFETTWRWCVDRLAFPLLLDSQIEWSWRALDHGSRFAATGGFLFLTAVWALMLALPLALIVRWWVWLFSRGQSPAPSAMSYSAASPHGDSDSSTLALPASTQTPSPSPFGPLYLLTMPLAVLWLVLRKLTQLFAGPNRPFLTFLRPILLASGLVFALLAGWYCFLFSQVSYVEWQNEVGQYFRFNIWYGWMDTLRLPYFFSDQWHEALDQTLRTTQTLGGRAAWEAHMDGWYRHAPLRNLIFFTALRPTIGVAVVMTALQVIRRLFH